MTAGGVQSVDTGMDAASLTSRRKSTMVVMTYRTAGSRRHLSSSPFNQERAEVVAEVYHVDDRVTHDRFGLGRLVGLEGSTAVRVDFGSHQQRVTLPCRQMTKL